MDIYTSTKVNPYVYMCIHKETGNFYIGYREGNVKLGLTSDEDFPLYKSSSKKVNPYFSDFNWYIVAEFNTGIDAYDFEQSLIFENWKDPLLLNKHCYHNKLRFNTSGPMSDEKRRNISLSKRNISDETKDKIRQARKKQITSDATRAKMSATRTGMRLGHIVTEITREKLRKANLGKKLSAETKEKISKNHRSKKKP